jgi:hypothetical protein
MTDGKISKTCVVAKCGKAAVQCLFDKTCRHAAECAPKALGSCSKSAFSCVFGKSGVCRDNIKCLAKGASKCGAPAVNMMTDKNIADFITCAGTKCPKPDGNLTRSVFRGDTSAALASKPPSVAGELLCMAKKCHTETFAVLRDQEVKNAMTCAVKAGTEKLCSSVWNCLGDAGCAKALQCWAKPLETCAHNVWTVLTNSKQRQRIEAGAQCLRSCAKEHADDFVQASFCVLEHCGQDRLDCWRDDTC